VTGIQNIIEISSIKPDDVIYMKLNKSTSCDGFQSFIDFKSVNSQSLHNFCINEIGGIRLVNSLPASKTLDQVSLQNNNRIILFCLRAYSGTTPPPALHCKKDDTYIAYRYYLFFMNSSDSIDDLDLGKYNLNLSQDGFSKCISK
jgi:hypothetical protein